MRGWPKADCAATWNRYWLRPRLPRSRIQIWWEQPPHPRKRPVSGRQPANLTNRQSHLMWAEPHDRGPTRRCRSLHNGGSAAIRMSSGNRLVSRASGGTSRGQVLREARIPPLWFCSRLDTSKVYRRRPKDRKPAIAIGPATAGSPCRNSLSKAILAV
jgi:hypothetical protein